MGKRLNAVTAVQTTATKTRYSDIELDEFKMIIDRKLEKAKNDLISLKEINRNPNSTDDTSPTFKVLEEGQVTLSKEENGASVNRQEKFIVSLENALIRIGNKTYGICRKTGNLIEKGRLMSVPHATLSIDAKLSEKKQNGNDLQFVNNNFKYR